MILVTTHETADFDCAAGVLAAALLHPGAVVSFPGAKSPGVKAYLDAEAGLLAEVRPRDVPLDRVRTLVLVDTVSGDRIGGFRDLLAPGRGVEIVCYDHHPGGTPPAGAAVHFRRTGAVSSLMSLLLRERGIEPTPSQATFLLLGIHEDTGGFLHAGTAAEDFEAASWLVERGASPARVSRALARGLTPDQVDLYHALLHDARPHRIRGQEVVVAAVATDRFVPDASVVVQQAVQTLSAERVAALIAMDDRIVLIVRSRTEDLDASRVAAALGGGGHPAAASAILRGRTLVEARDELLEVLRESVVPTVRAADLVTPILCAVPASATVREAVGLMNRHRVDALPITERGAAVGTITRQVADAALHHGLAERSVRDLVSAGLEIVPPEADLDTLQRRLLGRNVRFVLVGDGPSQIAGMVTRTALLRRLYEGREGTRLADSPKGPEAGLDLAPAIEKRLAGPAVRVLRALSESSANAGTKAYLVGGVVRDLLLRRENHDLDVVVEGDAAALARDLHGRLGGRLRLHDAFQTAALILEDGLRVDLATARTEHYARPGALPEVSPGGLRQDLFRRDFTVNALAIGLSGGDFGKLTDFFGGRRDLLEGKIRVLHGLSFIEDPTRALRAVRFAVRLDFEIARETEHLIRVAAREKVFDRLSPLRLRREIELLLSERPLVRAVRMLAEFRLVPVLHPDLKVTRRTYARLARAEEALAWYRLLYREEKLLAWTVALGVLAEDLSGAARAGLLERLRPARRARALLEDSTERVRSIGARLARKARPASAIHDACRGQPVEILLLVMALTGREETQRAVSHYLSRLRDVRPDIGGEDLLEAGVARGPDVARGLEAALRAKIDGAAPGREEQLAAALRAIRA